MIISRKHQFIFSKPRKVAGTSVEVALSKFCGPQDIITENVAGTEIDEDHYRDYARNWEGYFNHIKPARIRKKIGEDVWNSYFKFSIVRNPWDMVVSRYFWNKKNATPRKNPLQVLAEIARSPLNPDLYGKLWNAAKRSLMRTELTETDTFDDFLKKLPSNLSNTRYYFDDNGNQINDFVIRYEQLNEDFKTVCEKIGIPYEPLPSLKTKTRASRDYRELYNDKTRQMIADMFRQEIATFGYTFEGDRGNESER